MRAVDRLRAELGGLIARIDVAPDSPDAEQLSARLAVVEVDIARHENGARDPFHRLPAVTGDEL